MGHLYHGYVKQPDVRFHQNPLNPIQLLVGGLEHVLMAQILSRRGRFQRVRGRRLWRRGGEALQRRLAVLAALHGGVGLGLQGGAV